MMTETAVQKTGIEGALLSGAISQEIVQIVEQVKPSIVQVRKDRRGGGAGFVWRSDGAILTNHHVVAGGSGGITVLMPDGREFPARVTNQNPALDLALLQVEATDLPAALVDDSTRLRIGEMVFAIGHPWGQPYVVTAGIVSGLGVVETPGGGHSAQYVRSDVFVAPGNSGGPMLNARGAVVGITAMIFGGDMTVAIPSSVASEWVAGLPSRRVFLGVGITPVDLPVALPQELAAGEGAYSAAGLRIVAVDKGSPAHRAGVEIGDVLLAADGHAVVDGDSLLNALSAGAADNHIRLHLMRHGAIRELDVELDNA